MRVTYVDMMARLNSRLEEFNQKTRVIYYTGKLVILEDGTRLEGREKHKFIGRVMNKNGERWTTKIDQLLEDEELAKIIIKEGSRQGGLTSQARYGDKIRGNLNAQGWNKGLKTGISPWNKGLTKETDDRLKIVSVTRTGSGNPMYGLKHSDEYKERHSARMREKILLGEFTPNSNNRQTHYDVVFRSIKFRSSWEAAFYALNPTCEFETLRIKYRDDIGKERVYIVDFVDHTRKIAYEVKPVELVRSGDFPAKLKALDEWCFENSYTRQIITQKYFIDNFDSIPIVEFDENTQRKLKGVR